MIADGALPGDRMPAYPGWPVCRRDAVVAGRCDDDDAGTDGGFYGLDQRVGGRRFENRVTERQVDDVDAKLGLVRRREFDRVDHVAGVARAISIENLERDEP